MDNQQIRETLENQLQLLSERSQSGITDQDLASLTSEMIGVCKLLLFVE